MGRNGSGGYESAPQIGFAAAMREDASQAVEMRSRGAERVKYPWPDMEITRRISMPDAGSEWKRFAEGVDSRTRRLGDPVPLKHMEVTLIGSNEMSDIMNRSHPKVAASPDNRRRNDTASRVAQTLNGRLASLQEEERRVQDELLYYERSRTEIPDDSYSSVHFTEDGDVELPALAVPSDMPQMWGKLVAPVAGVDTHGPRNVTLSLVDPSEVMKKGRDTLLNIMHDMDLKVAEVDEEWDPEVVILETYPRTQVNRLALRLPAIPTELPLKGPRMYVDPIRQKSH